MKLLVNKDYGGFDLAKEAKGFLMGRGYSEKDAQEICSGRCPRDLPILHEAFKLFGQWEYGAIEEVELPDSPYCIEDYDGREWVITNDELTLPNMSYEDYKKKEASK